MTDKQLNERIRKIADKNQISYPENYDAFICRVLEELPEEPEETERRSWWGRKGRERGRTLVPAILLLLLVIVAAGSSVGAVVHGYLRRLEKMSEEKKEEYVSIVEETEKNGDYYSREMTQKEKKRGEELAVEYERGQRYPKQELPVVYDESEISEYRLYFVKTSSTFYLPEEELTDEELLEIIDFYFKREYSITARKACQMEEKTKGKEVSETAEKNTKKEAVALAIEYIKSIYELDVSKWKNQVESYTLSGSGSEKEYYCINFSTKDFRPQYSVEIEKVSKECNAIKIDYKENDIYKDIKDINRKEIDKLSEEGLGIVKKLDSALTIERLHCKYMENNTKNIARGVVDFVYIKSNQRGYVLNYNLNTQTFFSVYQINDISEYTEEYKDRAKKRKCRVVTMRLKKSNVAEKEAN